MLFSRGFQYSWSQVLFDQNNTLRQQIKKKNNFLSSYFKEIYLVSKCTGKRVADRSAVDTALRELILSLVRNDRRAGMVGMVGMPPELTVCVICVFGELVCECEL